MDCCAKIEFAHFRTYSKVSSSPGSNLVPNLSIFDSISVPQIHLKQASSFDAVLVSKILQNVTQKGPKMLCRNCGKRPWDPFGHIKLGLVSKTPPQPLKKLILTSYGGQLDPISSLCKLF